MTESMYVASYITTHIPRLSTVLGRSLSESLDDWVLWNRFWQLVVCDIRTHCWTWHRPLDADGYGKVKVGGKNQPIHRLVYQWLVGPIPDEFVIDHLCRTRKCVNPEHLEAVTAVENVLRGNGALAVHRRKTQCPQGHPYNEPNTIWLPGGTGRRCRTCADAYYTEHRTQIEANRHRRYVARAESVGKTVLPAPSDRTHCKRGHEYTPDNTYVTSQGHRQCRECNRIRDRERYENDPLRNASVKRRASEYKQRQSNDTSNYDNK